MDKIVLNKEQLRVVKEFIHSRGFHDPVTVVEILDHFACMIEERMEQNSSLTLEDAMYDAHKAFGVMGFRYIAANLEKGYRLKYKKTYRSILKEIFTQPVSILLVALSVFLIFNSYLNYRHFSFAMFDMKSIMLVIYLGVLVIVGISRYRLYKRLYKSKHRFHTVAYKASSVSLFILPQIVFIHFGSNPPEGWLYVAAAGFALLATSCYLELFIFFKTLKELMFYYKRPFELFTELTD